MSQAKLVKVPGGEAFIEVGTDYVRIGSGSNTFFMLDKKSISGGANSVNWQLSPDQMTYHGFLTHIDPISGFVPFAPKYSFTGTPVLGMVNLAITSAMIAGAVGF
ncbi:MAG: hypothetical protein EB127_00170 [Alphaproteobacteria bacterium]|nr:hypothetical protein [Alphaproteobacteria bacterium]